MEYINFFTCSWFFLFLFLSVGVLAVVVTIIFSGLGSKTFAPVGPPLELVTTPPVLVTTDPLATTPTRPSLEWQELGLLKFESWLWYKEWGPVDI